MAYTCHIDVEICSQRKCDAKLKAGGSCCGYDALISLSDPGGKDHGTYKPPRLLQVEFGGWDLGEKETRRTKKAGAAEVSQIINFVRGSRNGATVMISCPDGRCRASAAAMIAYHALGVSAEDAVHRVLDDFPKAKPNRQMLMVADQLLTSKLHGHYKKVAGIKK